MPAPDRLLAFTAVAVIFVLIPGPSVLFTITRALTLGRRAALLTVVGNAAGVYVHVIAVAFGVGAVIERSVVAFTVLKFVGAAYLVYLGVQAIRHRRELIASHQADHEPGEMLNEQSGGQPHDRRAGNSRVRDRRVLLDGFVVGVTNPKSVVFFAAILPQFVTSANGHLTSQLLILGLVAITAALVFDSLWALIAGSAREWFERSPRRLEVIGGSGGLVMIGLGTQLALTGRKD